MSVLIRNFGLLLVALCLNGTNGQLELTVGLPDDYNIIVNGQTWLQSGPTYFRVDGMTLSTSNSSLKLVKNYKTDGQDSLGNFKLFASQYLAKGRAVSTGIKQYVGVPAIVFSQSFEDLFTKTSLDQNNVVSGFPSFHVSQQDVPLGILGYLGLMTGYDGLRVGMWTKTLPKLDDGLESGPLVLFDEKDNVIIISPFNHFMSASFFHDTHSSLISWGVMGGVDTIPENFQYETLLFFSDRGINKAMEEWGLLMQKVYNKDSSARFLDPTVKYVGYYTDNGAFYYHNTEPGMNYQETMLNYTAYSLHKNIPYRYLQYDDWFYPIAGTGYGATVTWDALPSVFPDGLPYLYNKTRLPVIAHNRYWSSKVTYAKQNGGKYNFIMDGENSIPDDQDFWDFLLGTAKTWGLVTYEQDWLNFQVEKIKPVYESLTLGRRWLMQMGEAASRYGVYLQYCMSLPRHILATLEIPAVSHARASADYSGHNQWMIGLTSIFADAVGIAPFKDNFWTTKNEPGNKKNRTEVNPAREAIVALLSTGPVGPGDRIGYSNATLIKALASANGLLLKPSRPATAINAQIIQRAFGGGVGPDGEVWSTYSQISGFQFGIIFASELKTPFNILPKHVKFESQGKMMVHSQPGFSPQSMKPRVFDENHPVRLEGCDGDNHCLFFTSPVFISRGNSFVLIGEKGKLVPISPSRVKAISVDEYDLRVTLTGTPGEEIQFGACLAAEDTPRCFYYNCLISPNGFADLSFATQKCQ